MWWFAVVIVSILVFSFASYEVGYRNGYNQGGVNLANQVNQTSTLSAYTTTPTFTATATVISVTTPANVCAGGVAPLPTTKVLVVLPPENSTGSLADINITIPITTDGMTFINGTVSVTFSQSTPESVVQQTSSSNGGFYNSTYLQFGNETMSGTVVFDGYLSFGGSNAHLFAGSFSESIVPAPKNTLDPLLTTFSISGMLDGAPVTFTTQTYGSIQNYGSGGPYNGQFLPADLFLALAAQIVAH